jgi:hypothetical protein
VVTECPKPCERVYTQEITKVYPKETKILQAPAPPPQVHVVKMVEKKCCKPKPVIPDVKLTDLDEKIVIPEKPEVELPGWEKPLAGPKPLGNLEPEVDLMDMQVKNILDKLVLLAARVGALEENLKGQLDKINQNFLTLEKEISSVKGMAQQNKSDIEYLSSRLDQLEISLENYLQQLKGSLGASGDATLSEEEILLALENQISERGGLKLGPRWRLRFLNNGNNDLFLQDKLNGGYYRFRTTDCNHVVDGIVTNKDGKCAPKNCECECDC